MAQLQQVAVNIQTLLSLIVTYLSHRLCIESQLRKKYCTKKRQPSVAKSPWIHSNSSNHRWRISSTSPSLNRHRNWSKTMSSLRWMPLTCSKATILSRSRPWILSPRNYSFQTRIHQTKQQSKVLACWLRVSRIRWPRKKRLLQLISSRRIAWSSQWKVLSSKPLRCRRSRSSCPPQVN